MAVKRQKGIKGKADVLFSKIIRSQGYCEAEGYADRRCAGPFHTAHIVTRKRSATRCDTRNSFCLCAGHHFFFHEYPREFSHFISGSWADSYYDQIYQKSVTPTKVDWQQRYDFLQRIDTGEISIEEARKQEDI